MNYDLRYMNEFKRQKDTILAIKKDKKMAPVPSRMGGYCTAGFKSFVCDVQSVLFSALALCSFIFFLVCLFVKDPNA